MATHAGPDMGEDVATTREKAGVVNGAIGEVLVASWPPKLCDSNQHGVCAVSDAVVHDNGAGGGNANEGKALKIAIYGAVNAMMAIPILYGYAAIIFRWAVFRESWMLYSSTTVTVVVVEGTAVGSCLCILYIKFNNAYLLYCKCTTFYY